MTAKNIVARMLEAEPQAPVDPDDPRTFIKHYESDWERAGFAPDDDEPGKWVWREGIFSVEVIPEVTFGFNIYAYIDVDVHTDTKIKNAYAHKTAKTEAKALAIAVKFKQEIATSLAAQLIRIGFTGWRNHWHKAPIDVTLRPSRHGGYANIKVAMDYVPSADVIKTVTGLDQMCSEVFPAR